MKRSCSSNADTFASAGSAGWTIASSPRAAFPPGAKWSIVDQQLTLHFPATSQPQRLQLLISAVMTPAGGRGGAPPPAAASLNSFMNAFAAAVESSTPVPDLAPLREPGASRWPAIETQAVTGTGTGALTVDTFTVPEDQSVPVVDSFERRRFPVGRPRRRQLRSAETCGWCQGIGPTLGTLSLEAICHGAQPAAWREGREQPDLRDRSRPDHHPERSEQRRRSGLLRELQQRRHRAGQLPRVHDALGDRLQGQLLLREGHRLAGGFRGDPGAANTVTTARCSVWPPMAAVSTSSPPGLRHPNGFTVGPNDEMAFADNQGNWLPTSVRAHDEGRAACTASRRRRRRHSRRHEFEKPIVWLPHAFDNSPANPIWIPNNLWGPLGGKMLLMSYGKATLSLLMTERVEGQIQGAIMNLPLRFDSVHHRPADGSFWITRAPDTRDPRDRMTRQF